MTKRIALILGAGPNIGQSVAKEFKDKGYRVAVTSRSADPKASSSEDLSIQADLSHPEAASEVFEKVKSTWGVPHVVIYNGKQASLYHSFCLRRLRRRSIRPHG